MTISPVAPGFVDLVQIGAGGLGDVYRATRESTNGLVALKFLRQIDDASSSWRRVHRELAALVELKGHPHVVGVEEVLTSADGPVIVMEYAPGGTVYALIQSRGGLLQPSEVLLIALHTASAVVAAHALGIVHRDIKPHNLLISSFGQVKVCDFGIASMARHEQFRSRTSALSYQYASPEELDDEPDVGPPTDIYSLGATLQHALSGRMPKRHRETELPWDSLPGIDRKERATVIAIRALINDCLAAEASTGRPPLNYLIESSSCKANLVRRYMASIPKGRFLR